MNPFTSSGTTMRCGNHFWKSWKSAKCEKSCCHTTCLSPFFIVALLLMVTLLPGILIIKKQIASGSLILTVTNSFQVSDQRFFFVTFWWQATFSKQACTLLLCCITGMEQNCCCYCTCIAAAATDVLISWTCMNGVFFFSPRLWKLWLGFSLTTTTTKQYPVTLLLMDPKSNQLLEFEVACRVTFAMPHRQCQIVTGHTHLVINEAALGWERGS